MKRDGTKYAVLLSKKFTLFRTKGDALTLCDYIEADSVEIEEEKSLVVTHSEEVDLMLYEVQPKNIDDKKFYQADKIAGFPYVDISKDPVVNSFFVEKDTGKKWIVIKALSSDPIDSFSQVGLKRYYGQESVLISINTEESSTPTDEYQLLTSDMINIRNTTGSEPQTPLDVYETVVTSDIFTVAENDTPKVIISYEGSYSLRATGASGGKIWFILQKSFQPEAGPESWEDVAGTASPFTLLVGQEVRRKIAFSEKIPGGIPAGWKLAYRLKAKRESSLYTVILNSSLITGANPNPAVMIGFEYNYVEPADIEIDVVESAQATDVITLTAGAVFDVTETVSGSDVTTLTIGEVLDITESASGSDVATLTPGAVFDTTETVNGSDATTMTPGAVFDIAEAASGSDIATLTVGAVLESIAESAAISMLFNLLVPDPIFNAPPANPAGQPLVATEVITDTTVTIPAEDTGYPRVRFLYSASMQFIFTGAAGGSCTLQIEKSEDGGAWADVDTAVPLSSTIENHEERTTITATDEYETGIPVSVAVQYRVKVTAATDVSVHSSLIDTNNTAPTCLVSAEYEYDLGLLPGVIDLLTAGSYNSLLIKPDNTLWSCGQGSQGATGQGITGNITTFTKVGVDTDWEQVTVGFQHSFARKSSGTLWSCGLNSSNQLGRTGDVNFFLQVGVDSGWASVSAGGLHTAALRNDGTIWACGLGAYGQLGNGDTAGRSILFQAGTDTDWTEIACSFGNTHALKSNGTLWGCGDGTSGQLGVGGSTNSNVFIQAGTDTDWSSISAGGNFIYAIKSNGTLWSCGSNLDGQLGRMGDNTVFAQVGTDTDWTQVSCGSSFVYARKTNGEIWGCGDDTDGQLGGLSGSTGTMTKLSLATDWSNITCGEKYVFAQNTLSELWTTGTGSQGELGLGDELPRTVFEEVVL